MNMDQQETIQLPIAVISGLFKNCLVDLKNPETVSKNPEAATDENLATDTVDTVVFSQAEGEALGSQQLDFLHNVMKACKLEKQDYAIITNKQADFSDYQSITRQYNQKQLILFGIDPAAIGLPINFPHFQVQSFQQVRYLAAPTLEAIEADKALKIQLWQCLKQLYPS
ncbi:MAG: hypothetical protein LW815_01060 [Chitinophagaceae bacterium]|jgi:hypothetical protein|nr:hypothetical protein [Chitinophagaceae bacterium]